MIFLWCLQRETPIVVDVAPRKRADMLGYFLLMVWCTVCWTNCAAGICGTWIICKTFENGYDWKKNWRYSLKYVFKIRKKWVEYLNSWVVLITHLFLNAYMSWFVIWPHPSIYHIKKTESLSRHLWFPRASTEYLIMLLSPAKVASIKRA